MTPYETVSESDLFCVCRTQLDPGDEITHDIVALGREIGGGLARVKSLAVLRSGRMRFTYGDGSVVEADGPRWYQHPGQPISVYPVGLTRCVALAPAEYVCVPARGDWYLDYEPVRGTTALRDGDYLVPITPGTTANGVVLPELYPCVGDGEVEVAGLAFKVSRADFT